MSILSSCLILVFVKDQVSHQVLIAGRLKDGLYAFEPLTFLSSSIKSSESCVSQFKQSSQCNIVSLDKSNKVVSQFDLWYKRLGHTSVVIVKSVLNNCNISDCNKIEPSFCSAC